MSPSPPRPMTPRELDQLLCRRYGHYGPQVAGGVFGIDRYGARGDRSHDDTHGVEGAMARGWKILTAGNVLMKGWQHDHLCVSVLIALSLNRSGIFGEDKTQN